MPRGEAVSTAARLASQLGGSARVVTLGGPGLSDVASALGAVGAASVAVGEHEALADYHPEGYAQVLADQIRSGDFAAVILPASTLGKDLAPRVAAMLDVPLASDATGIEVDDGVLSIIKPVYSGKAFAHLSIDAVPAMITIRPNAFSLHQQAAQGAVSTFTPDIDESTWRIRVVERKAVPDGALDVSEATTIVSGGRGMKNPENWALLESLRDALEPGVALGASRGRGGRWMAPTRRAGGPDGQDGRAEAVLRGRHLRRDSTPRRNAHVPDDRSHQQGRGCTHLRCVRLRHRGGSLRNPTAARGRGGCVESGRLDANQSGTGTPTQERDGINLTAPPPHFEVEVGPGYVSGGAAEPDDGTAVHCITSSDPDFGEMRV